MAHFAYVFERFPSFTQTFCAREVLELERQGTDLLIFSIRDTRQEPDDLRHFPEELVKRVCFLPQGKELVEEVQRMKSENRLPQEVVLTLRHWGGRPDKQRVYEAAWIGQKLKEAGVRHAHTHFAGIGARTCWWMRVFYKQVSYSFTGHANDIWCKNEFEIGLDRLVRDAACVISVSDFSVRGLRSQFPGHADKIHRVYNGLDLSPFELVAEKRGEPAPSQLSMPPLLFSVGRLIEKKGFSELIAACSILGQEGRELRCRIAGDGPLEDDLQRQIRESAVGGATVTLLGPQSQDEIREMLLETTVFVLPCVTESDGGMDNLPTVIMEAMAASVPCVSTRLAGVPEMVLEGETGLLVDEGDTRGLVEAIGKMLEDPEQCRRFGQAGRARAKLLFAQEVTARHLLETLSAHGNVNWSGQILKDGGLVRAQCKRRFRKLLALFRGGGSRPVNPVEFPEGSK